MYLLKLNGYDAYYVGGYVRDLLLKRDCFDFDIITSAKVEEIDRILNKRGKINKQYFAYHIKDGNKSIDITTYRKEYQYKNNKPSYVEYTTDLYTDLERRDFTINALCMGCGYDIKDFFGGQRDINLKVIKCIGQTDKKLSEDSTRVVRAIRFMCVLDFNLDDRIVKFIRNNKNKKKVNELNNEYLKKELDLIFNSNYDKFFSLLKYCRLAKTFKLKYKKILPTYNYLGVWAQVSSPYTLQKIEKRKVETIKKLVKKTNIELYDIYKYDKDVLKNASMILNKHFDIDLLYKNLNIHNRKEIDITSKEIEELTNCKEISKIYENIEKSIILNKLNNKKDDIIKYIRSIS